MHKSKYLLLVLFWIICQPLFVTGQIKEKQPVLYWAEMLVQHITTANTSYRHKNTAVAWPTGSNKNDTCFQSHTDCSGLINALLKQAYQFNDAVMKSWLGTSRPLAFHYFNAVCKEQHFKKITNIHDLQAGDLLVIKYADRSDHDDNTGHCMLVAAQPILRVGTAVRDAHTLQYEVLVIDASKSPHGKIDTRYIENGMAYAGTGQGLFRLYADAGGVLKGYSWSMLNPKPGFDPFQNPIVAGRLNFEQ